MPTLYDEAIAYDAVVPYDGTTAGQVVGQVVSRYSVVVVGMNGTRYATLANAEVEEIHKELNGIGSARFSMHVLDAQAVQVQLLAREVQIWRTNWSTGNAVLVFWGVPVRGQADERKVTFECAGLLWYLTRRHFGPIQSQYLLNPEFESGLTHWTAVNCTAVVDAGQKIKGTQSARLTAAADQDAYLGQYFNVTTGANIGQTRTFAAWFRIAEGWTGPAFGERGLYVRRLKGGVVDDLMDEPAVDWVPITNDTRFTASVNGWHRVELEMPFPEPNRSDYTADVRLYCPGGAINWDATSATGPESTATTVAPQEVKDFLNTIITSSYGGAQATNMGKSDLRIGFLGDVTGRTLLRNYQWSELANIWSSLEEYPDEGLSDFDIVWNDAGTTRTFTSYYPKKGSHKAGLPVNADNLERLRYAQDGTQTATSVLVLGRGDGPDRELGKAKDTTSLGGLVLERIITAPQEATVDSLGALAIEELARAKQVVKVPEVTVKSTAHIEQLKVGDTIPVVLNHGWVQENGTFRVASLTENPAEETLTIGLNTP